MAQQKLLDEYGRYLPEAGDFINHLSKAISHLYDESESKGVSLVDVTTVIVNHAIMSSTGRNMMASIREKGEV